MADLDNLYEFLKANNNCAPVKWNTAKPTRNGSQWFIGKHWQSGGKDIFIATIGDFKSIGKKTWKSQEQFSPEEKIASEKYFSEMLAAENAEREATQNEVAPIYEQEFLSFASDGITPYMGRKKIPHLFGARIKENPKGDPILIVPLRDVNGKFWNYQKVYSKKFTNGDKFFSACARVTGCFHALSDFGPKKPILISEGFATAASIQLAHPSVTAITAFNAGNLLSVAKEIRRKYPFHQIAICADNDQYAKFNIGLSKATDAAKAIGAELYVPKFKNSREGLTDFNDLHSDEGLDEVTLQLDLRRLYKADSKVELKFTSLKDLFALPPEPISWVVDQLLKADGTSVVSAKPKVGKTTLVRQLALSVAKGSDFLGRKCTQGTVLYLAAEENQEEVLKHFRAMGADGSEAIFIHANRAPKDVMTKLKEVLLKEKPILIILDPIFRIMRVKDGNAYSEVTEAFEEIQGLARDTKVHVLCVHHNGKAERDGGDAILGSTAIFGGVDMAIIMNKKDGVRTIETEPRYGDKIEKTKLNFDVLTRRMSLGKGHRQSTDESWSERIIVCLKKTGVPMTEAEIAKQCPGNKGDRSRALRQLVDRGGVSRQGEGKRGNSYLYSLGCNRTVPNSEAVESVC